MGYRIDINHAGCINCGICMDTCPVEALDMSRPQAPGIETAGFGPPQAWMMEHPIQVGECIGCGICIGECPVVVMTLVAEPTETVLAPRQGPIERPIAAAGGRAPWLPLASVTREVLKREHPSPWGDLLHWETANRDQAWQVWRSMKTQARTVPIAPCQAACPAGTDAGRYVGLIGAKRFDEAYAVAAEVNPFPSVCGWICTAPCESVCRRGVLDEPIAIRTLKRFAAEHGHLPLVDPPAARRTEKVGIVGGGPAGMSAAYYLTRLGYPVTVFEAMPVPGGMMAIGIPSYRLPRDVLQEEIARIVELGVDLRLNAAMGRDFTLGDLENEGYRAVFLATGASKSRRLGVPGDDVPGVVPATLFLKRVNLGEEPHLSGPAVVVGGGSTAMDAARSAWRSGASPVTVIYRRGRAEMPAQVEEIEAAEREGIIIRTGLAPVEVLSRDGTVIGIRCTETAPTGPAAGAIVGAGTGADRRPTWIPVPGTDQEIAARTILVAVGEEPDPSILPEGAGIEVSGWAGIVADPRTLATGRAGIFAGGDVVSGPKTIIDAVASGRRAAASIHEYLAGVADGEKEIFAAVRYRTARETQVAVDLSTRPRAHAPLPMVQPGSFEATQVGFDERMALAEAGRCFRCDAVYAGPTYDVTAGRGPDLPAPIPVSRPTTPDIAGGTL
jgi:NADPH-dependent glutamate synthase beta subunit-like oxidoreductase/NAD-dependent dihydropyrimidine dehydrogenase PreA subunit